jgi:hypothetical protein
LPTYKASRYKPLLTGILLVVGQGLILVASQGVFASFPVDVQDVPHPQQAPAPDEIRVSSHGYLPPSPYSIRVETKLVELNVTVRDWKGHAIDGLKKQDFHIYDEGREREIAAFSEEGCQSKSSDARCRDCRDARDGSHRTSGIAQDCASAILGAVHR